MTLLRVVVADDQRVIRDGMRLMLSLVDGIDVVAVAADGDEAVTAVAEHDPDVVLMDLRMPRCDGVTATARIRELHPRTQVVVLTTFAEDTEMLAALRSGARGYLTKDASADEVVRALRRVTSGEADLAPQVQRRLLELLPQHAPAAAGPAPDGLTDRELQVLRLVAEGLSNTEIAGRLHVSDATVKTHINHVFAKTGVRDRAQAVAYAYRHRLVDG
ncbi:response regulator [Dactylosporangium siamense]|uniref:DNA-binding response regulator n=1 Tax=Dactylosporangium siamense TaxID=685454 RepID=A0A919PVJ2_9ACTN|nr:response regulator transcription factor [Dactylosporangium siamense]GIG51034.1 DNA-binding response regulator [Dactylosporangium siamense]